MALHVQTLTPVALHGITLATVALHALTMTTVALHALTLTPEELTLGPTYTPRRTTKSSGGWYSSRILYWRATAANATGERTSISIGAEQPIGDMANRLQVSTNTPH